MDTFTVGGNMLFANTEKVTNIIFMPESRQLVITTVVTTLAPDGTEIGTTQTSESVLVPEEDNLLDILLAYRPAPAVVVMESA
jgi:hypothetical protein